jgi:hypothetical protein
MDNPSSSPASAPQSELKNLQEQYASLQQLVSSLMLVLIVVSGTLGIFLLRQYRFAKSELDGLAPAATQLITDYTNNYAMTQDFLKKLAEYGRTHPEFGPIMARYRLTDALPKPDAAVATSSLPVKAAAPKK